MSSTSSPPPPPPPIPRPPRGWHRVEPGPDNELGMYFDPSRPPKDFHDDRRYHRRAEPEPPARRNSPHRKKSLDRRELERPRYISRSPSPKPRMPPRDRSPIDVDRLTRSGDFRRYHEERELSPRTITNIQDYLGLSSNRRNETSTKAPREAKPKRPASPETDIYGNPPDHKYYNPSSTLRLRERRDEEPRERKKKSASPPPSPSLPGIPHRFRRTDDHNRNDRESDDRKPKPRFERVRKSLPQGTKWMQTATKPAKTPSSSCSVRKGTSPSGPGRRFLGGGIVGRMRMIGRVDDFVVDVDVRFLS